MLPWFRVHSTHLLGLFLLMLAWFGIVISCLTPDWQRSIADITARKSILERNIKKAKFETLCDKKQENNARSKINLTETNDTGKLL